MLVDLVATTTTDDVRLHGIFFEPSVPPRGEPAVDAMLLVHGSGGSFYASPSNRLVQPLRERGVAVAIFNNRGHDIVVSRPGEKGVGNAFEILDECRLDIDACVGWLAERGYKRIGIWGSSLGAVKVIYAQAHNQDPRVAAVISLSPLRLSHEYFAQSELAVDHLRYYEQAKALVEAGKPNELMEVDFPIKHYFSAAVYWDRHCGERYNLAKAHTDKVRCPLLILGGSLEDHPRTRDAARDIHALAKDNPDAEFVFVEGGDHGLQNKGDELMEAVLGWLDRIGSKARV